MSAMSCSSLLASPGLSGRSRPVSAATSTCTSSTTGAPLCSVVRCPLFGEAFFGFDIARYPSFHRTAIVDGQEMSLDVLGVSADLVDADLLWLQPSAPHEVRQGSDEDFTVGGDEDLMPRLDRIGEQ